MVSIGMIFQFNSDEESGLIMLSNGETKEFGARDWVDESNAPAVGLKISYEDNGYLRKIKVPSEEEINNISSNTNQNEDPTSFTSLKEYENHYLNKKFVTVGKTKDTLKMQKYSIEGEYSVSISFKGDKPELTQDLHPLTSIDDHIQYFKDMGYKLASDSGNGEERKVSLRTYSMDDYGEVSISYPNSKINVTVMMNGKKVF
ncbi:MAG: hypothetical protein ACI9TV_001912 [Sulfurimonas sp.]|jgi:hypothetical protein|uniref:hypothetical protein n=1 Tax=Sulfurimonas sp. TaxID=2022749 RepID=UPI0039E41358